MNQKPQLFETICAWYPACGLFATGVTRNIFLSATQEKFVRGEINALWPSFVRIDLRTEVEDPNTKNLIDNPHYGAPYATTDKNAWQPGFARVAAEVMKTAQGRELGNKRVMAMITE